MAAYTTDRDLEKLKGRYAVIAAVIGALGTIIAAVIGFYAVVVPLKEQNNTLQQQNEALVEESQETGSDSTVLQDTISALQSRIDELETQYEALSKTNADLKGENAQLKENYAAAQSTIENLENGEKETGREIELPTNLQSETLELYGAFRNYGTQIDNHGTEHENCIGVRDWYNDRTTDSWGEIGRHASYWTSWDLNYQYEELSGIFFHSKEFIAAPIKSKLTIYGNTGEGKSSTVLFSGQIDKDSEVRSFRVSLHGMAALGIQIEHSDNTSNNYAYLSDVFLWK